MCVYKINILINIINIINILEIYIHTNIWMYIYMYLSLLNQDINGNDYRLCCTINEIIDFTFLTFRRILANRW